MSIFDLPALQLSAGALIFLIVILVLTGRLVPRRVVEDTRADRDARIAEARAEAATWRKAWELEHEVRVVQAQHIEALLEVGRTTTHVLASLPTAPTAPEERASNVVA